MYKYCRHTGARVTRSSLTDTTDGGGRVQRARPQSWSSVTFTPGPPLLGDRETRGWSVAAALKLQLQ